MLQLRLTLEGVLKCCVKKGDVRINVHRIVRLGGIAGIPFESINLELTLKELRNR